MKPMYVLCPHCSFPVVVHPVEVGSLRRCRQCRAEYVPGGAAGNELSAGKRSQNLSARSSLRAAVRQQRRSLN